MDIESLEVYARDSNYAVVKPPGRRFPGCVIQGDSLAMLCRMANNIARAARENRAIGDDFLENVQELNNSLIGRILHYQHVLQQSGIELPYSRPFSEKDLVAFFGEDESP